MGYIGSTWREQYYTQTPDVFSVAAGTTSFTLKRPVASVSSLEVSIGNTILPPEEGFYSILGNTLTLGSPITDTLTVRYLTANSQLPGPIFNGSIDVNAIAAVGIADATKVLRGDGSWSGVGIPINNINDNYTLQASDNGKCIVQNANNTRAITLNAGVFGIGDAFMVLNSPNSSTLVQNLVFTPRSSNLLGTSTIANAGSGYTVGDSLQFVGGTDIDNFPASVTVSSVDGTGGVTGFTVGSLGGYYVPPANPISVTGGTGALASFNAVWQNSTGIVLLKAGFGPVITSPFLIAVGGLITLLCVGVDTYLVQGPSGMGGS